MQAPAGDCSRALRCKAASEVSEPDPCEGARGSPCGGQPKLPHRSSSVRSIAKYYVRGDQVIPVLVDINLDVTAGDYVALMGPSGSGKTTLLNLIAGIDTADVGTILVAGDRHHAALPRGELAALARSARRLHLPVLQPDAGAHRVRERRAAAAAHAAVKARAARARRDGAARRGPCRSRWTTIRRSSPAASSSASPSRARIVTDPTIIVADEPTGDLDRDSAEEILDLLDRLNRELRQDHHHGHARPEGGRESARLIHLEKG